MIMGLDRRCKFCVLVYFFSLFVGGTVRSRLIRSGIPR